LEGLATAASTFERLRLTQTSYPSGTGQPSPPPSMKGRTVFVTTDSLIPGECHRPLDVVLGRHPRERCASDVALLENGRLTALDAPRATPR
jgi:hypothetical protein